MLLKTNSWKIADLDFTDFLWYTLNYDYAYSIELFPMTHDTNSIYKKISTNNIKGNYLCVSDFSSEEFNEEEPKFWKFTWRHWKNEFNKKKNHSREMFLKIYPDCLENIVSQSAQINVI